VEKHYQVFVSSNFGKLTEERRAVVSALLDLNCRPVGTELFGLTAAGQWPAIERMIDESDYVLVIPGSGPPSAARLDVLEREYGCATAKGKPVMAFLRPRGESAPGAAASESKARFRAFRTLLEQGSCRRWKTTAELSGAVSRGCSQLIRSRPAEGWVRGGRAKTDDDYENMAQLTAQVRVLERELAGLRAAEPQGAAALAQGDDPVELEYSLRGNRAVFRGRATWSEVFLVAAMKAIELPTSEDMATELSAWLGEQYNSLDVELTDESLRKVRLQFFALGLMETRPVPQGRAWALTAAGRKLLGEMRGQRSRASKT